MAKVKACVLRKKTGIDGTTNIKIRLTHDGKAREINTPWYIEPKYMGRDGIIKSNHPSASTLNKSIGLLLVQYNKILDEFGPEIIFTDIGAIVNKLRKNEHSGESFTGHLKSRIEELKKDDRGSSAGNYNSVLKLVRDFSGKDDILFKEITLDYLIRLRRFMTERGKEPGTRNVYFSLIKGVFTHAIKNKVIKPELNPFINFEYEKKGENVKKNLTPEQIHALVDLPKTAAQQKAWDMFMLSFYLNGLNTKDLFLLQPENIMGGRVTILRYKTKTRRPVPISVKIVPEARAIINRYKGKKYVLEFMDHAGGKERKSPRYRDFTRIMNRHLENICKKAGFDIEVSTNFARHTFATLAYKLGIPESTIAELLGHSTGLRVTNHYIERDYTKQDEAQRKIIDSIKIKRE